MSVSINWILSSIVIHLFVNCCVNGIRESVRFTDGNADCMSELMSAKYLPDDHFSASSYIEATNVHRPSAARLVHVFSQTGNGDGSAWCPVKPASNHINEWIQVDFRRMTVIKTIYTMGRGVGNYNKFTPEILIKYQRSDMGPWITYRTERNISILSINTDARTILRLYLQTIIAKRIKIYPLATTTEPLEVCLKFALLGCFMQDEAISYTAPQGDLIALENVSMDLRDNVYDGQISSILQNGLGILMDNVVWRKKFNLTEMVKDKHNLFTGWSCESGKKYINITVNFEQEREFSLLKLYSVKDLKHKVFISGPITISIFENDKYSHIIWNLTDFYLNSPDSNELEINILLNNLRGNKCTINITCNSNNLILLSEIEIKSVAAKSIKTDVSNLSKQSHTIFYFNTSDKHTTTLFPDYPPKAPIWKQQDITVMVMVILITLLVMFVIGIAVICFKFQRSRRNKLTKKLEMVAQCNIQNTCSPNPINVYTIQTKTPSTTTHQPKYFTESKTSHSLAYSGSQPSDGVYASWPNTDDDPDLPAIDKEEEKCLLAAEVSEKSSMKEYATYQCGLNASGTNDYIITDGSTYRPQIKSRPSSTVTTLPNLSSLSVPLLKIVGSCDAPKSTPIVTYRSAKKPPNFEPISYQHFLNYKGICGDVDFRYQQSYPRGDHNNLESNIRVIPIISLIPIQPLIRGEFGAISVCKILSDLDSQSGSCFFVKSINPDSKTSTKTSFIMELKILSSINCVNVAKLEAIAIDNDLISSDIMLIIKSTRFYILIDHLNGYNLKDFLRSTYYSNVSQEFKSTQSVPYSQISISSLLIIMTQIANGMKHFEELGLTHRDLACRNCIIDMRMHIKIYPGGMVTTKPNEDYCSIELINHLVTFPLRWMAPESIIGGLFTIKSDVWSFAVTLWEIFTLCSLIPYGSLTNEALLDLMSHRNNTPRLPCPQSCPKEIFDLMSQCWNWDESMRPGFREIYKFLQFKTTNCTSQAQIILPAPPPDDKYS